ncbi:pyruvate, water dikinase regulatory protein [Microbacterium sp. No. 7]|uniref:pyruvate, water dikinase regulatory protein n=1 Tax=Microbacterium sp. No. 7 TaxID=1714373 RepID=UPI0006ED2F2E|nr:pyruvate, water dikinase regulatory protein [Microbacterium sp. No. 7]ALJ19328.1 transcriptional regulator [Microbacterium sp. No. 7]
MSEFVLPPTSDAIPLVQARRAAFFVSDSTGITAETLGSALLVNFPEIVFDHHTMPFVDTPEKAAEVVQEISRAYAEGQEPVVFTTVKQFQLRKLLHAAPGVTIDLLAGHLVELEGALGVKASERPGQYHALGDLEKYHDRMRAVEYAIEHDDGQSGRALDLADVIIVAPSRCGKTPTTMYLALQYGLLVANYPLTDDDFPTVGLPKMIAPYPERCFGLITTAQRLSQVRSERRPQSHYASLEQCTLELRRAEDLYRRHNIPYLNSSAKSVEEMSAVIIQSMRLRAARAQTTPKNSSR